MHFETIFTLNMKGGRKCIKAASNQCILRANCINIKHEVIKCWKVQDLKNCTVGGVTNNQNNIILANLRF